MKDINPKEVGARIRALREAKDLSRKAFGKVVNVNPMTLYLYEEKGRIPNAETLLNISKFVQATIEWLLTGKDQGVAIKTKELMKDEELELLEDYYKLNERHRYLIKESIASYLKAQK